MKTITVAIAGWRHQPIARAVLRTLPLGAELRLVREPENEFDSLATAVYSRGDKLGYVPRVKNFEVAWAMDGGTTIRATYDGQQEMDQPVMTLVWS